MPFEADRNQVIVMSVMLELLSIALSLLLAFGVCARSSQLHNATVHPLLVYCLRGITFSFLSLRFQLSGRSTVF